MRINTEKLKAIQKHENELLLKAFTKATEDITGRPGIKCWKLGRGKRYFDWLRHAIQFNRAKRIRI